MQKKWRRLLWIATLGLGLFVLTNQTPAENTEFESVSGFFQNPAQTNPGTAWLSGNVNYHFRGVVVEWDMLSSDVRLDGATIIDEVNGNQFMNNQVFNGTIWGKFWIYQLDGGVWEGSFQGKVVSGLQQGNGVATGRGGSIDGKKLKMTFQQIAGPVPAEFEFQGEIH